MKNIKSLLFLFVLIKLVQCEIWGNQDHSGNIWGSPGSHGQNDHLWINSEQNGNSWKNPGNHQPSGNIWSNLGNVVHHENPWNHGHFGYNDNFNIGYNVQYGNTEDLFSSTVDDSLLKKNNNQASQDSMPTQSVSSPAPDVPATNEQPTPATDDASSSKGNNFYPQFNFYQPNEVSSDFQAQVQKIPVIDLTQALGDVPQFEPIDMTNATFQEELVIATDSQPTAMPTPEPIPVMQKSLSGQDNQEQVPVPIPALQQFLPKPEALTQQNSISLNINNQPDVPSGNLQFGPWQYVQSPVNSPQASFNLNQGQFNMPPFDLNKPNGDYFPLNNFYQQNVISSNIPSEVQQPTVIDLTQSKDNEPMNNTQSSVPPKNQAAPLPAPQQVNTPVFNVAPEKRQASFFQASSSQHPTFDFLLPQENFAHNPQFQLQNTLQHQINVPVHPGYNYRPNGNSLNAGNVRYLVKRSYEVNEKPSDFDPNFINRMWLNGHGYPIWEGRNFVTSTKNRDVEIVTPKDINNVGALNGAIISAKLE